MLQRTVSYKSLLRIIGGCFLLYGAYIIVLALTAQVSVSGDVQYTGPWIFEDPIGVRNYLFCGGPLLANPLLPTPPDGFFAFGPIAPGPLLWVSIGMLCLSVTCMRVNVVFICLQIALWLISLSVWFPIFFLIGSTDYDPVRFVPFGLITLAFSLALLAAYKPVTHFLRKLCGLSRTPISQTKPLTL